MIDVCVSDIRLRDLWRRDVPLQHLRVRDVPVQAVCLSNVCLQIVSRLKCPCKGCLCKSCHCICAKRHYAGSLSARQCARCSTSGLPATICPLAKCI